MEIKPIPTNYWEQTSNSDNLIFLWKSDTHPIYVMDNHLAAPWCWFQECNPKESYNFMHIDAHADLKESIFNEKIDFIKNNPNISLAQYLKITYLNNNYNYPFFQWDNYIRACYYLFPNWFNYNYFYTLDGDVCEEEEFATIEKDTDNIAKDIIKYIGNRTLDLSEKETNDNRKWIINFDLDIFWDIDGNRTYNNNEVRAIAKNINDSFNNIQVLTFALSPECIGGEENLIKWKNVLKVLNIFRDEVSGMKNWRIHFPSKR